MKSPVLRVTAITDMGEEDPTAVAILNEDGIIVDGAFTSQCGITWEDIAKILQHPYAQDRLQEVELSVGFV